MGNTNSSPIGLEVDMLSYKEIMLLKEGDSVCVGLWKDKNHRKLNIIHATVTKKAYYNADCDEPDWEIETSAGIVDFYSLYNVYFPSTKKEVSNARATTGTNHRQEIHA